jgi:hypothetical protein
MTELFKTARKNYPRGTYFISATGKLNSPLKVTTLKISEISGDIVDNDGGVIYDKTTDVWAKIF